MVLIGVAVSPLLVVACATIAGIDAPVDRVDGGMSEAVRDGDLPNDGADALAGDARIDAPDALDATPTDTEARPASCAACASGQQCSTTSGQCVCDATSCPSGCCNGTSCVLYAAENATLCGTGGAACASCANGVCDTTNGTCTCDSNTCLNGCCSGGTTGACVAYASETNSACGANAQTCSSCTSPNTCTSHSNGIGETFKDCNPSPTYNSTTATEACTAFTGSAAKCTSGYASGNNHYVCSDGASVCDCWCYSGSSVGLVHQSTTTTCYATVSGDPTWN